MSTDDSSPSLLGKLFGRNADTPADEDPQAITAKTDEASKEEMVDAAERFHLLSVEDVMVPRADIVAVDTTATLTEISETFKEAGHSRLPVYKDTLDEPVGMVHIKDVLPYLMFDAKGRNGKTYPQKKVIQYIRRPVMFVPPSMLARDLLKRMQAAVISQQRMKKMMSTRWEVSSLPWQDAYQSGARLYVTQMALNLKLSTRISAA